ncbi:MAG TPA: hypothetical protein DEQ02_00320, partial [Ruminococcaceae bacterium]|nr:hypothetical protein [Oscillospiraceae bacterium]
MRKMKKVMLVCMIICLISLCACVNDPAGESAVSSPPASEASFAVSSEPVNSAPSSQTAESEPVLPVDFSGEILKLPQPSEPAILYPVFIKVAEPELTMYGWDGYIRGALDENFNPVIKAQHKNLNLASIPSDGEPLYYEADNPDKPGSVDILDTNGKLVSTIDVDPDDEGYGLGACIDRKYFIAGRTGAFADRLFRLNGERITLPEGLSAVNFNPTNQEDVFTVSYDNRDCEDERIPKGNYLHMFFNAETGDIIPTDVDTALKSDEEYRLDH